MNGGKNRKPASFGYTIIEVMLFLAISGFMFVMAAIFINGKQAATEFRQGMNDVNTAVRTTVNEVANGEYQPLGSYTCSASPGAAPTFLAGAANQGANNGCIFLGKVIQFDVGGKSSSYNVYTVAARQFDNSGSPVTGFASAMPCPVSPVGGVACGGGPELTESHTLEDGLQVKKVLKCTGGDVNCTNGVSIGAFGLFGSFNGSSASLPGDLQSGSQSVTTAALSWVGLGDSQAAAIGELKNKLSTISSSDLVGSGTYILLCFQNGTQQGSVSVGGAGGQQFTTTIKIGGIPTICKS